MSINLRRSPWGLPGRIYAAIAAVGVICGAVLSAVGVWDLLSDDPEPAAFAPAPAPAPEGSIEDGLARLAAPCEGLSLRVVDVSRRDTPAGGAVHPFEAVYLRADLDAGFEGARRSIVAEGAGKGPAAEADARRGVLEAVREALAAVAPACFDH